MEDKYIKYVSGKRFVHILEQLDQIDREATVTWKDNGVYLITGGAGGLGLLFAQEIVTKTNGATLVLTGRSELDEVRAAQIEKLEKSGAKISYRTVDVCDKKAIKLLIQDIKKEFGTLNGILHSAGVIQDNFIIRKTKNEFEKVLAPKVQGAINLDEASKSIELDFFIMFSSISAPLGSAGQVDYAAANAFMDVFAKYRSTLSEKAERSGHTLSINWPFWKEGGMKTDAITQQLIEDSMGTVAMKTTSGLQAFYRGLSSGEPQVIVMEGYPQVIKEYLYGSKTEKKSQEEPLQATINPEVLYEKTLVQFKILFGDMIRLSAEKIDAEEPLESYGIDSILITQLNQKLEQIFGEISKTLFFEYQTLGELTTYFITDYRAACAAWSGLLETQELPAPEETIKVLISNEVFPELISIKSTKSYVKRQVLSSSPQEEDPIAIIGVSGRYPQARNLEEYWENLKSGKDCITVVPEDRWSLEDFFYPDKEMAIAKGKSYSKWGGFMDGFSEFDPLFFNISPREALNMDPQERLFLQSCWHLLEDAGYTRERIATQHDGNVGVFAGITKAAFDLYGPEYRKQDEQMFPHTSFCSVANRVSYIFNLHGPSMPVDTQCSSSLTAIHEACEYLRKNDCEMAIAGGVNLYLHPSEYAYLCSLQMLSTDGMCKSFGEGGNGFVPGEGVGVVLLKRLSKAIEDKDQIHAVIRGTNVNHGGKTNGYTVPNPKAQGALVRSALDKAGIDARKVSYVEAHGTGTALGDPIEVTGLRQAFEEDTRETEFCALGSSKSNIGHLEAAAGIAGVTKILLQMKHQTLVPTLHAKKLNPNIDFKKTPFVIQQETAAWKRPVVQEANGEEKEYPRIAGISSFGAGGSNAHIILEEYVAPERSNNENLKDPAIVILSAKNKEQLHEQVVNLSNYLDSNQDVNLHDIAYTLQTGREPMEERFAIITEDLIELKSKLTQYQEGKPEGLFVGNIKKDKLDFLLDGSAGKSYIETVLKDKEPKSLAQLWIKGVNIDWTQLYDKTGVPNKISLPTYPFAKENYWLEVDLNTRNTTTESKHIHPLVHNNTSTLEGQRFSSTFNGEEFFLEEYHFNGDTILPGAIFIEMALAAFRKSTQDISSINTAIQLNNVKWAGPEVFQDFQQEIHIDIFSLENKEIAYEIYAINDDETKEYLIHNQGVAKVLSPPDPSVLNLEELQENLSQTAHTSKECYDTFNAMGINYGSSFKSIEKLYVGSDKALAKLSLASPLLANEEEFILHPVLLDAVIQGCMGLQWSSPKEIAYTRPSFPLAIDTLKIIGNTTRKMWAYIRYSETDQSYKRQFDIDLCDELGKVCVTINGLSIRTLEEPLDQTSNKKSALLFKPVWNEKHSNKVSTNNVSVDAEVFICGANHFPHLKKDKISKNSFHYLESDSTEIENEYGDYALGLLSGIQQIIKNRKKGRTLLQVVIPSQGSEQTFAGLSGLLKTLELENPKVSGQIIAIDTKTTTEDLESLLKEDLINREDSYIRYEGGKRLVRSFEEIATNTENHLRWKENGIYLITGGTGGLGQIFAREIARESKTITLILTGRSELSTSKAAQIKGLEKLGIKVLYRSIDVSDLKALEKLILEIQNNLGNLNGIIHSAGIIRDNYIIKKTREEFEQVLAPKVKGLVNLDEATKALNLDFFVLFSSVAGSMGNVAQADYATANAFMDAFAAFRSDLCKQKKRSGQTLAINWPLWKEGGMHVDDATLEMIESSTGMIPMKTTSGINALYRGLYSGASQIMVTEGQTKIIRQYVRGEQVEKKLPEQKPLKKQIDTEVLFEKTLHQFKILFGEMIKLSLNRIDTEEPLESYGIDSIMITQLNHKLERIFGEISKTLFFEYQTLSELAGYFTSDYPAGCAVWTGLDKEIVSTPEPVVSEEVVEEHFPKLISLKSRKIDTRVSVGNVMNQDKDEPIAIIGVSGRYPKAHDLEKYWENLRSGEDCISIVPQDRWSLEGFFHPDKEAAVAEGKSYSKWGGFLEGYSEFDPLFFNISPHEALTMDPQERIFLQSCWHLLEDAGYTRERIAAQHDGNVGVFAGITKTGFDLYGPELWKKGEQMYPHTSFSSVANRVSYMLNLRGPSMPIDTMCSSSLTAIHEACEHLRQNECEMAIAGGVNLYLHPSGYIHLCSQQMLSEDGQCKSFGKGGNGYVPGEGVGVVLLKPLSKAIEDQDQIHAVIKGTSVNHGGKTNGYTVPNPKAHGALIRSALGKAGIGARKVSYIEAHGTGTALGDPIEITGLRQAFEKDTKETEFCALGSAKSNIGHLEAAAGIAGVTKILLQMKHQTLVPTLHAKELNPNIDFKKTPFVLQQEAAAWKRPVFTNEIGEKKEYPRIAGISSFGAGGSNAHIVLEEYISESEVKKYNALGKDVIIPLSAKTSDQLQKQAINLLDFLKSNYEETNKNLTLHSVAYTLQIGREGMDERVGFIVSSIAELKDKLQQYIAYKKDIEGLFEGNKNNSDTTLNFFNKESEFQQTIESWIANKKFTNLLMLWVNGMQLDWNKFYTEEKPNIISLPKYPFAKDAYWVGEENYQIDTPANQLVNEAGSTTIHPLLHRNTSNLSKQSFASVFSGKEFFLKDHLVDGKFILPGVAYLEMMRVAVEESLPVKLKNHQVELRNIFWLRPLIVEEKSEIEIILIPEDNEVINFEIHTKNKEGESELNCQGEATYNSIEESYKIDIEQLKEAAADEVDASYLYNYFENTGVVYGSAFKGIKEYYTAHDFTLAKLSLPETVENTQENFILHPSIMDSALQSSIGLTVDLNQPSNQALLPYALEKVEIFSGTEKEMYTYVRYSPDYRPDNEIKKFDISICDSRGTICIEISGFSARFLKDTKSDLSTSNTALSNQNQFNSGVQYLAPVWNLATFSKSQKQAVVSTTKVLLVGGKNTPLKWIQESFPNANFLEIKATSTIEEIGKKLNKISFDQLIWIAPDIIEESTRNDEMELAINQQEEGVLNVYRITKSLLKLGYADKDLSWTIITGKTQQVNHDHEIQFTHGSVFGFVGSLAKEYAHWNLRLLDVDTLQDITAQAYLALPYNEDGNGLAKREGEWFQQEFARFSSDTNANILYKQKGVYVIIGGAGGLGELWSQYMIDYYHAQVIWIGRKELNSEIEAKINTIQNNGIQPIYISADATNKESLKEAYNHIKQKFPVINGVVHSAIVLKDKSIMAMDEDRFKESLSAKVNISVLIESVFGGDDLDFILFFSSLTSYSKAAGQSNYAAGCTFKDSFAQYLKQSRPYEIKTMNWGYWGNVGIVTDQYYKDRMAQSGVGSIEPKEGMKALEVLMSSDIHQMGLIKAFTEEGIRNSYLNITEQLESYNKTDELDLKAVKKLLKTQDSAEELQKLDAVQTPKEMELLAANILAATLISLGLFENGKTKISDLSMAKTPAPFYDKWLNSTISYLQEEKYLSGSAQVLANVNELDHAWAAWDAEKKKWNSNANWKSQVILLETCLKGLPAILKGKQLATDIIFPDASLHLVEGVYKGSYHTDYLNMVLGNTLEACIHQRIKTNKDKEIRILEIGAGTGGTTVKVLPLLKQFDNVIKEYCYTDLSRAFLIHAEENYQPDYPKLTTAIFDVSRPVASQAVQKDQYDFVIATNVLHATPNIRQTLRNAKAVLKDQGVILLNEMSTWTLFTHLTFGLLEGWWLYEDDQLRLPGSPGLNPEKWEKALSGEGFEPVIFPIEKAHQYGHQVIAARSDGRVLQKVEKEQAVKQEIKIKQPEAKRTVQKQPAIRKSQSNLRDQSTTFFKELVAKTLKMKPEQIDPGQSLENYGLDSILVVQLTNQFRKVFPDITSTLFFEEHTVYGLVDYFIENKKEALEEVVLEEEIAEPALDEHISTPVLTKDASKTFEILRRPSKPSFEQNNTKKSSRSHQDIAVIGLSGRYPKSENINEFWKNLLNGENCITEIPKDRWNWEEYYDSEKGKSGKIYTKWGGFINDIDKFDPLFFRISPKDAKKLDPQERIFIETCYHAIEDAGYTPENLANFDKVGVFAGIMNARYTPQPLHYSVANRVSYTFNFQGPSMAVDTACSASLTAIHLALESIQNGTCECAIAGGVNVIIDPEHYIELSAMTMLSSGNQCKAFGNDADGFVDSEGVGAVILKPLHKAEADGDHIYGVIKGSAVNAGGKTNGYTVPNPKAQAALVTKALENANLNKEHISYIEAHGTGTSLGDPIEISALSRALKTQNGTNGSCAIGSVKSNIGHCESASGVAGLTKVLLQLKHKKLVPSINAEVLNPEIDFGKTPFKLQRNAENWKQPVQKVNGQEQNIPRLAGISSFGAGGANAHVIVSEYARVGHTLIDMEEVAIVLSARTSDQLSEKVQDLLDFIADQQAAATSLDLVSMAYTLQVGREAMEERLAVVAGSIDELTEHLQGYLKDASGSGVYRDQVKVNKDSVLDFSATANTAATVDGWLESQNYSDLLAWWVKGLEVDWAVLYADQKPLRMSLPTYPFARERYWLAPEERGRNVSSPGSPSVSVLHPLVHSNTSNLTQIGYSTHLSGSDALIKDYSFGKNGSAVKALPLIAGLEMARASVARSLPLKETDRGIFTLKDIRFGSMIELSKERTVEIALFSKGDSAAAYEIYSEDHGEDTIYSQGEALYQELPSPSRLNIDALINQLTHRMDAATFYEQLSKGEVQYGSSYQGIATLHIGTDALLAHLILPEAAAADHEVYHLHPVLLESALQAATGLLVDLKAFPSAAVLPHSIGEVQLHAACTRSMYAWIRHSDASTSGYTLDIDLCDTSGAVCVALKGVSYQQGEVKTPTHTDTFTSGTEEKEEKEKEQQKIAKASIAAPIPTGEQAQREVLFTPRSLHKVSLTSTEDTGSVRNDLQKPTDVSLSTPDMLTTEALEKASEGKARIHLSAHSDTPLFEALAASDTPEVRLYGQGNGVYTLRITGDTIPDLSSAILMGHLLGALQAAREADDLKVLVLNGMASHFLQGGPEAYNQGIAHGFYQELIAFPYPVIAAMQGAAHGAGFLAGALCDFMIGSEQGMYGYTQTEAGLYANSSVRALLSERFGAVLTRDLLENTREDKGYSGGELKAKGWTFAILPKGEVEAYTQELAANLSKKSATALRLLKQHLSRHLKDKVSALTRINNIATKTTKPATEITTDHLPKAKSFTLHTAADGILSLQIGKLKQSKDIELLIKELNSLFTAINKTDSTVPIVITSETTGFLPQTITAEQVIQLANTLQTAKHPLIGILDKGAEGKGWLVSQYCDAILYTEEGNYSTAGLLGETGELSKVASVVFAQHLGDYISKEVLLVGTSYTGSELQGRRHTLRVVKADHAMTTAMDLARIWQGLPWEIVQDRKQEKKQQLKDRLVSLPNWQLAEENQEKPKDTRKPGVVELQSDVVKATLHKGGILEVRLEDREARNMFTDGFIAGVNEVFAHIAQDTHYKVVVLTGYDNYFASGGTREGLLSIQEGKSKFTDTKIYQLAMECKLPVIAAMQGHGIGGGWSLGMFADFILFSKERKYVSPYMNYGFTPGAGATFIFPQRMGYDLTRETMFTADEYSGITFDERGTHLPVLSKDEVLTTAIRRWQSNWRNYPEQT